MYLSIENYNERQNRSAQRVLDMLDQLDSRLGTHYSGKRRHTRVQYRGVGTVCVTSPEQSILDTSGAGSFSVHVRSLSQSGLSFIYPGEIPEKNVFVGLDQAKGGKTWFVAEIVRVKEISEEGFWEYGVRFVRRAVI
ncbi:MAG: PilZ domain-containing protein [Planctomycetaceae bacterium]|nr:PilZ domain-containing protein [Planctomycetaceae bacterium]